MQPKLFLVLCIAVVANAAANIDVSTIKGKWLYGYQGWFRKPANGVNNHWSANGATPGPGNSTMLIRPDVVVF